MRVAIASENDAYDGVVFERLLARALNCDVGRWRTDMVIQGHAAVVGLGAPYLRRADAEGVRHALFAIDNDGGARRGPEHESQHDRAAQAADPDGCRTCRVLQAVPPWWWADGRRFCVAVPVQTLETWLLFLRGDAFPREPEKTYYRWLLKKRFFGKPLPPEAVRARLALEQIDREDAVERLKERPSFRLFLEQLVPWP